MNKSKAVIWYFPIILCTVIFFFFFSLKYNRPISGIVVGCIVGFVLACLSYFLYDDFYHNDVVAGFTRGDCPPIKSFEDAVKIPYYFFYMWFNAILTIGACLGQIILVLGAIVGGIVLIIYLISSGF
jgi:hypothetical protein